MEWKNISDEETHTLGLVSQKSVVRYVEMLQHWSTTMVMGRTSTHTSSTQSTCFPVIDQQYDRQNCRETFFEHPRRCVQAKWHWQCKVMITNQSWYYSISRSYVKGEIFGVFRASVMQRRPGKPYYKSKSRSTPQENYHRQVDISNVKLSFPWLVICQKLVSRVQVDNYIGRLLDRTS